MRGGCNRLSSLLLRMEPAQPVRPAGLADERGQAPPSNILPWRKGTVPSSLSPNPYPSPGKGLMWPHSVSPSKCLGTQKRSNQSEFSRSVARQQHRL